MIHFLFVWMYTRISKAKRNYVSSQCEKELSNVSNYFKLETRISIKLRYTRKRGFLSSFSVNSMIRNNEMENRDQW